MANILKIRAHHLLCIQGFQGYGYSEDFVKNMIEIIENIDSNPEAQIITECDVMCSCCPYNVEGVCQKKPDSAQKVKDMDMRILRKLNLKDGTRGRIKDFLSLANTKIRNSFDVHICGECDWKEKCLWFISQDQ
ncbi:MAG: DUF1284 domain-containing protein [Candidatus Cloacimonadia bacterium]